MQGVENSRWVQAIVTHYNLVSKSGNNSIAQNSCIEIKFGWKNLGGNRREMGGNRREVAELPRLRFYTFFKTPNIIFVEGISWF